MGRMGVAETEGNYAFRVSIVLIVTMGATVAEETSLLLWGQM